MLLICSVNVVPFPVVPLKDKKGTTIANLFLKFLNNSKRKPNEIWVDQRDV